MVSDDYRGQKRLPTVVIQEGERVELVQPLAHSKMYTEVVGVAPGAGLAVAEFHIEVT